MRLHVLQHVIFEGPGSIAGWVERHQYSMTTTKFYEAGWALPALDAFDGLVVMGGPMGVHDEAAYAWLAEEKAFLKACVDVGKRVVGICLGAQLLAQVLGAEVKPMAQKEIGWYPVFKMPGFFDLLWDMPDTLPVLHWHGDCFSLPEGAEHMIRSEACEMQAFSWKRQVLGLQFHLEMRAEDVDTMLDYCGKELKEPAAGVQDRKSLLEGKAHCETLTLLLDSMLTRVMGD